MAATQKVKRFAVSGNNSNATDDSTHDLVLGVFVSSPCRTLAVYFGDIRMSENVIYRLPAVRGKTGLGKTTIYSEIAKGKFPAPIKLTDDGRAVGWLASEVDHWVESRAAAAQSKSGAK